jgi:D-3-phosphoglycerate dehydrogenase
MENGEWPKKEYKGFELSGKTLGLIGFGNIAKETAKIALGLGMSVCTYDRNGSTSDLNVHFCDNLDEMLSKSDVVSLHIPFDKEEGPTIGKEQINKMKDGSILINCARGGVVDEGALLEGLKSGKIAGAGIDVWINEPPTDAQTDLIKHPNVSATPHIGGTTKEAQDRVGIEIAEKIVEELKK